MSDQKKTISSDTSNPLQTLHNLWPYMWPSDRADLKRRVLWAAFFLVLAKLAQVVVPYFFKWATDALNGNHDGLQFLPALLIAPVMLVLDKSGSMVNNAWDHDGDAGTPDETRWATLYSVTDFILTNFEGGIQFGLQLFPSTDATTSCANDPDCPACDVAGAPEGHVDIPLDPAKQTEVERITSIISQLKDLRWRYVDGPSGTGRAVVGFANSTGCSSVWGDARKNEPRNALPCMR